MPSSHSRTSTRGVQIGQRARAVERGGVGAWRVWTQLIFESSLSFQRDGRLSNLELADRIGLTPAPCLRRVKRLESDGVILGYTALINPAAMGRGFQVLVNIDLTRKEPSNLRSVRGRRRRARRGHRGTERAASTSSWFVAVSDDRPGGRVSALKCDGDRPVRRGCRLSCGGLGWF